MNAKAFDRIVMKRTALLAIAFLILAGALGGFGYYHYVMKPAQEKKALSERPRPPATVSAVVAEAASWRSTIPAIGTVKAFQGVDVAAEVAGTVETISFASGADIKQGTDLVVLNLTTETAELEAAQAQLRDSERKLARQRTLKSRGVSSGQNLDDAIATRDSDKADVERINALIDEKTLSAPFDGRLGIRQVDIGQYVSPGDVLVTLQQLDPVYVDFPVPEQRLKSIAIGDDVEVVVDAFAGQTFTGKITSIDVRIEQSTRNILVRARFANADKKLLPGMFANVKVLEAKSQNVVTVARTAVTISLIGDTVFVAKPDKAKPDSAKPAAAKPGTTKPDADKSDADKSDAGKSDSAKPTAAKPPAAPLFTLEQRRVTVGQQRDGKLAITSGLKAGEMVVIAGQNKIFNGQKVHLSKTPALQATTPRPRP
jgi:RND family efflux transporter MFP subunit